MQYGACKALAGMLCVGAFFLGAVSQASCPVYEVIVNGRVEDAPAKGTVRVQLIYPNQKADDSGEVALDSSSFRIQIPFLTQSRAPVLIGTLREKCDRKPETVVVTLVDGDREYDRVSLSLAKDFRMADASAYALRSEVVLHGHRQK
jgi:hypothetical protein